MLLQFLKKSSFLLCAGAILVFTSCAGEETESNDAGDTATESINDLPTTPLRMNTTESDDTDGAEAMKIENDATQNSVTNKSNVEVKLNPAHGEPGHVCEIPVGQPLPSKSSSISPASNNTINMPVKSNNTANLNPPHGEPGHKCEIPVGEPLN